MIVPVNLKKMVLLGIFLILTVPLYSQSKKTDSISAIIKLNKQDTSTVNSLNALAAEFSKSNPDSALLLSKRALELSKKINFRGKQGWKAGIAKSYQQIASCYDDKEDYPQSIDYYQKALKAWDDLEAMDLSSNEKQALLTIESYRSKCLSNIGVVYRAQGNYPKALEYYFRALKIDEITGNKKGQAKVLGNIGIVYDDSGDMNKALNFYFQALNIDKELGNKNGIARHFGNIGVAYDKLGDYDKVLDYYSKAMQIDEQLGNKDGIARHLGNIGGVYLRQGNYSVALEYLLKALKIDEEQGNKKDVARHLGNIGMVFAIQQKYSDSESYLKRAVQLCDSIGALGEKMQFEMTLSEIYAEKKDYKKSLEHYKNYQLAKDSLFNEEKEKELTRHELNYEFEKKTAALKAEQDKKEAVGIADKKRQQIFLWLICFILLAVAVIALIIFRSLKITKKQKLLIMDQKIIVEEKQKEILDSIHYARRIQSAILPTERYIEKNLRRLTKKT